MFSIQTSVQSVTLLNDRARYNSQRSTRLAFSRVYIFFTRAKCIYIHFWCLDDFYPTRRVSCVRCRCFERIRSKIERGRSRDLIGERETETERGWKDLSRSLWVNAPPQRIFRYKSDLPDRFLIYALRYYLYWLWYSSSSSSSSSSNNNNNNNETE